MKFRVSSHIKRKPHRAKDARRTRCCVHAPDAQLSRQMTTTCWRSLTPPRAQLLFSCPAPEWFNALPSLHSSFFHLSFHIFTRKKLRAGEEDADLHSPRTTDTFSITFLPAGNIVSFCCGGKWLPSTGKAKTTTNTRKTFSRTMLWNLRFAPAQTLPPSTWFYSWLLWLAVPLDCGSVSSNTKL